MRGALFTADRTNPIFSVNLTMQQLKVLWLLSVHDAIGSQELARNLGVTPATLSGIVDRLVAQGYVARTEDPDDRRVRRIHLSPTGRAAMEEIMDSGTKTQRRLFDRLDDSTLEMIETVLNRITDAAQEVAREQGLTCTG